MTGSGSGCPPPCLVTFREAVGKLPCVDALPGSAELMAYTDMVTEDPNHVGFAKQLRTKGCKGAVIGGLNVCGNLGTEELPFGFQGYTSIKHICPVTCGCTQGALGCPDSCPYG